MKPVLLMRYASILLRPRFWNGPHVRGGSLDALLAMVAMLVISLSMWHLHLAREGVSITRGFVGATPITIYRAAGGSGRSSPVILIAHGFAGSQELMQPFATTFARNGYVAVTFDFLGHGRNPLPLNGSITDVNGATRALVNQTAQIAGVARSLGDGRLAVLGHSMASDIIVRFAKASPHVDATVAVSMFSREVTPSTPRNLLVIVGGFESTLKREALRAVGQADPSGVARPGVTYGDFRGGTARRAAFSDGVEHIGVLYSPASMAAALAWLDASFGVVRLDHPYLDDRGPWILLLLAGIVVLARPLSRLLPVVSVPATGAALGWRAMWPCVLIPAIITPLMLRVLPTHFLPILVGDYLSLHFGLYGLITLLCLRWRRNPKLRISHSSWPRLVAAALAITAYAGLTLGWELDHEVTSFVAVWARIPLILAMLIGTLSFFLSDEWLTRGNQAARGAYTATKVAFVFSLAIAIALDLERLFFLVIIVPVIVMFFLVFGAFSGWSYKQTRHPLVAGFASAVAFAWAIGVTFPMVAA